MSLVIAPVLAALLFTGGVSPAGALHHTSPPDDVVQPSLQESAVDRVLRDERITESSGLARSTRHDDVLLTHNDNGDTARYFAVGPRGYTRAVITLRDATAVDWEDIATGGNHQVWLADIGDNAQSRSTVDLYRVTEPTLLRDRTVDWTRFTLSYPDGAHDAEALLVNPITARVFVVSKAAADIAAVYRAPRELDATGINVLERVTDAPPTVTAGDFAPGGGQFVLRDYQQAYLYARLGTTPTTLDLPEQGQGESLTYTAAGTELLVGSEGTRSPVWRVPLPAP